MKLIKSFYSSFEEELDKEFLKQGYVIFDVSNREALDALRRKVVEIACEFLGRELPDDDCEFLDNIHDLVDVTNLNPFRLAIYNGINDLDWLRPTYYSLGKSVIDAVAGNELAMQNRVNLSIQMPQDDSSLIAIHSDSFSGETPFQVVHWVPLVDVRETKSMFILPPEASVRYYPRLKKLAEEGGMDRVYEEVAKDIVWLDIPFGKMLVFSPSLLHGNIVNSTSETRWSLNCRFTGLFTPYSSHEKSLGGFYLPITLKASSRIGMNYRDPEGF